MCDEASVVANLICVKALLGRLASGLPIVLPPTASSRLTTLPTFTKISFLPIKPCMSCNQALAKEHGVSDISDVRDTNGGGD